MLAFMIGCGALSACGQGENPSTGETQNITTTAPVVELYTRVGYHAGKVLYGIDIVCPESTEIPNGLSEADFSGMENLSITVQENVVHITIDPAVSLENANDLTCEKYPVLNVFIADATIKTSILDDAIYGTHTYAGITREYALYLPKDAEGNVKKNVPLVVWNHGGGEYGTGENGNQNLAAIITASRGFTAWNENGYEAAVLQIHVSNDNYSYAAAEFEDKKILIDRNNALQADLILSLIEDGTVDPSKVYISGGSSGGGATMRFLMQYPELFAGAIPCCSMDPIVTICFRELLPVFGLPAKEDSSFEAIVEELKAAFQGKVYTWDEAAQDMVAKQIDTDALLRVPIHFVHAESDEVVVADTSKAMYEAMVQLADQNNVLTLYTDDEMHEAIIGHGVVAEALWNIPDLGNGMSGKGTSCHFSYDKMLNEYGEGTPMDWLFQQTKISE